MRRLRLTLPFLLLAFPACQDVSTEPTPDGTTGTSRVLITDDPFPYERVARVDLYIVPRPGPTRPVRSASPS